MGGIEGEQDHDDGLVEADENYEEYFFKDQGEGDQYVKVVEDDPRYGGDSSGEHMALDGAVNQGNDSAQAL